MSRLIIQPKYLECKGVDRESPPGGKTVNMVLKGYKVITHPVNKFGVQYVNEVKYPLYEEPEEKMKYYHVLQYELPADVEVDISEFEAKGIKNCLAAWVCFDGHEYGMLVKPEEKNQMFEQPVWLNTDLVKWSSVSINLYFADKPDIIPISLPQRSKSESPPLRYDLSNKNELPTFFSIDNGFLILNKVDSRTLVYNNIEKPVNKLVKI